MIRVIHHRQRVSENNQLSITYRLTTIIVVYRNILLHIFLYCKAVLLIHFKCSYGQSIRVMGFVL